MRTLVEAALVTQRGMSYVIPALHISAQVASPDRRVESASRVEHDHRARDEGLREHAVPRADRGAAVARSAAGSRLASHDRGGCPGRDGDRAGQDVPLKGHQLLTAPLPPLAAVASCWLAGHVNPNVTRAVYRHQISDTVTRAPAALDQALAAGGEQA